jgi:hypothetical protein
VLARLGAPVAVQLDARLRGAETLIGHHDDVVDEGTNSLVVGVAVGERGRIGRVDAEDGEGRRRRQAELRFESRGGPRDAAHVEDGRVHRERDSVDVLRLPHDRARRLDGGVGQVARGVVLEQRLRQQPVALALEPLRMPVPVTGGLGQSLVRVDGIGVGREAAAGETRRQQAPLGGVAGVERLRHGAEVRLEPARLRCGQAHGPTELLRVEVEEPAGGGGGAEDADARRDVPALGVVRRPDAGTEAGLGLDADDEGGQELGAAAIELLGQGEGGREHGRARMATHHGVGVVEIEGMAGGTVHERRRKGAGAEIGADHRRGPVGGHQLVAQDVGERLGTAGDGAREPVEDALARHGGDVARHVGGLEAPEAFPQPGRDGHGASCLANSARISSACSSRRGGRR